MASIAGPESAEIRSSLLAHLRLHFQLLLAPIFLWGYFLSGVRAPADFWLAFVAFSIGVQALGAALLAIAIAQRLDPIRAALVVGFYALLLIVTAAQANEFQQLNVMRQQRRVMVLNTIMSGGFFLFLAANLFVAR